MIFNKPLLFSSSCSSIISITAHMSLLSIQFADSFEMKWRDSKFIVDGIDAGMNYNLFASQE